MFYVKHFGTIGDRKPSEASYIFGLENNGIARKVDIWSWWRNLKEDCVSDNTMEDDEIKAITTMLSALSGLDEAARDRVFAYICTRLNLKSPHEVITQQAASEEAGEARSIPYVPPSNENKDIRTFKEQKSPRSATEMAAVVAYFLQYDANEGERKDSITKFDVEKYFHLAKFKMPKDGSFTLVNSKNAGYLDQRVKVITH